MRRLLVAALVALPLALPLVAQAGELVLLGRDHQVGPGENLLDIARTNGLGYVEMLAANPGVDPWIPAPGIRVLLPIVHLQPGGAGRGIVVNLADMRLYLFGHTSVPVGIGKEGWGTSSLVTRVVGKRKNPSWTVPASIRAERPWLPAVVPPGPDNPLGRYSLDLADRGIRIHGTNRPDGVGRRVSHGCFRLYPEDIERLYPMVPVGTAVTVVDQPAKLAWVDGALYLEAHPSPRQADALEAGGRLSPEDLPGLYEAVESAAGDRLDEVDWGLVAQAGEERRGMPVRITVP